MYTMPRFNMHNGELRERLVNRTEMEVLRTILFLQHIEKKIAVSYFDVKENIKWNDQDYNTDAIDEWFMDAIDHLDRMDYIKRSGTFNDCVSITPLGKEVLFLIK